MRPAEQPPVLVVDEAVAWPEDLVAQWHAVGKPIIPLSPGVTIVDLEKWLDVPRGIPLPQGRWPTAEDFTTIRLFMAGLP